MSSGSGVTPAGGPRITGAARPRPPPPPPGTCPPRPPCAAAAAVSATSAAKANAPRKCLILMALIMPRSRPRSARSGFDFQHRPERLIRQRVEEAVGPWFHFADALLQLGEENLAADGLALRVEPHVLDVLAGVGAHGADEHVALPCWKRVAVVNRQPGDRDRRHPEYDRLLEPRLGEALADDRAVVVAAERNDGPAV